MKASAAKPNVITAKKPPVVAIVLGAVVAAGLIWGGAMMFNAKSTANYAEEVARPLESALTDASAVKKCSRDDNGRGTDNNKPWYYAIYEVPGDKQTATELVQKASKEAGYQLADGSTPPNPEDNEFYEDHRSKESSHTSLESGKVNLDVEVFGSSTYTGVGDRFCTVTKRDNPPTDRTTIRFTINLPAFKR